MSGHSKWSTIKHKKAAADAKRGRVFTRLLREVTVAARLGGGDPDANPRLRNAVQEARANNVPGDNIERAIKKGTGELEGVAYEELVLEGYGPGGVAILVEGVTDNRNRTVSEIRHLFSRHGGSLGESGCVSWMFDKRAFFLLPLAAMDEESVVQIAADLDVEDFAVDEDGYQLFARPEDYETVRQTLRERQVEVAVAELSMMPQSYVKIEDETAAQVIRLMEALEDHDDVQHVWANFDIEDSVLERVTG